MMAVIVPLLHAVAAAQDRNLGGAVAPMVDSQGEDTAVLVDLVAVEEVVSQDQIGSRRSPYVTPKTILDTTMTMKTIIQTIIMTE